MDAPGEEALWVERLAGGDREEPIRVLYGRYGGRLYGLGLQLLGDRGMAEELVQETFVRLWRSAPRFDRSRGSVRTYIFTIARRAAVDMLRRPATRPLQTAEQQDQPVSDEAFADLLLRLDVREALGSLSDKHRETLELHYDSDLTQREIAERIGVPLGTVKTRTFHALRALRVQLEERGLVG